MSEVKIAEILEELIKPEVAADVEKTLSYYTEDAVMTNPYGTFKGKDVIKHLMTTTYQNMKDIKFTETGNGIIVQGNKAFVEQVTSATFQGKKCEFLTMCAYEFAGDKIKAIRNVYDRLLIAQQVAKGWPAKPLINMIVRQSEKAMK